MRRYGGEMLYATLPLHMQRGCFRIRTHDQQVTKAQLYRCIRARPQFIHVIPRTILLSHYALHVPPINSSTKRL